MNNTEQGARADLNLALNDRHRAMLAAMGVRVWWGENAKPAPEPIRIATEQKINKNIATSPINESGSRHFEHKFDALPDASLPSESAATPGGSAAKGLTAAQEATQAAHLDWDGLSRAVAGCRACGLCAHRLQPVLGTGPQRARWMVIGEAPGEQEDRHGEPFVGPAGQLLDAMLDAMGLTRTQDVYIANVIKCRPPQNRNPLPEEVARCKPYLLRQIELVQPDLILALGRFAANALLQEVLPGVDRLPLGKLRGRVHRVDGRPVVVSYHPAYLLRSPSEKAKAWADLCLAMAELGHPGALAHR
jgi:DNA polymerase